MTSTQALKCVLAAAFLAIGAESAVAADPSKIVLAVAGMEKQIYLPAKLCEQLGYFKAEGLDVEMINTRAGVDAENELIAGEVQAVVGFYDHTIDIQSKGKSIISIVQLSRAPGEVELVADQAGGRDQERRPTSRARRSGITGVGSSTDFLTQALATRAGLKPGDYSTIGVGAGNTFIAAIKQGKIDAGMTTEPTISQMVSTGEAKVLIDMRSVESTTGGARRHLPGRLALRLVGLAGAATRRWRRSSPTRWSAPCAGWPRTQRRRDRRQDAEGVLRRQPRSLRQGPGRRQGAVHRRRSHAGRAARRRSCACCSSPPRACRARPIDLSKTYTTEYVDAALKIVEVSERTVRARPIEISGVTRRFLTPSGKFHTAMRDFSLTIARGEFVCVVGPTGCGKSTALNLVTGLIRPSAGQVKVMGRPVPSIDRRVGFVFQSDALVSLAQRPRQRRRRAALPRHAQGDRPNRRRASGSAASA